MDFPHIDDTKFPIIDNVNVYKYQNNFDYARWEGKVSFKLLNVLWNSNYSDVPFFETDVERDNWFKEKDGYVGVLETLFNNTPTNVIKIPIPYNEAYKYNYLVVDMPVQTSIDNPINYEDANNRVNRWYYFIEDMTQFSPNTTELQISVDYWTTFIHSVEIPYLKLERGHAPMMQIDVDTFLNNPISNNEYLLAPDFNYGDETIIQTSNYVPIGNGKKYVLFCVPIAKDDFANLDSVAWSGESTPPTYSNTAERWGYQIQVNDYQWKYGDADYSNAKLPINNCIQTGILNGCECYAIEGIYARSFFNEMAKYHVHFIHAIQAMFILDENLFYATESFKFNNYTIYIADRKMNNVNLQFRKEQFGFDSKYSEIAKLYTFPYSSLEITDDDGNSFIARIENCGRLQMHTEVSLVYPFLNYNVFLSGVNGDGTMNYKWMNINDTVSDRTMWASDFSKFMMNWNVPTYSIFVSSENEYAAHNFASMQARRAGAIKDYENAVRYANTTRENTADSFETATENVERTTTKNVGNVKRTEQGLIDNSDDLITLRDDKYDLTYGDGDMITGGAYVYDKYIADLNKLERDVDADKNFLDVSLLYTEDYIAATTAINAVGGLAKGAVGSGEDSNSNIISAGFDAIASSFSAMALVTNNSNMNQANKVTMNAKKSSVYDYVHDIVGIQDFYERQLKNIDNRYTASTVNRFSLVTPSMGASVGINVQNVEDEKTCNDANALATQTTETDNATYSREANVVAEKANLVQKQLEAEAQYKNARLQKPVTYSEYSGDFSQDIYKRRGVRFNVRTQSKSAIAQVGDAFLRFGYALHRVWDMSNGFHYGKHFTFWKAEDIWINDGNGVANTATNTIGQILMKGVTVWKNPDEIGMIGIYDNI